MRSTAKSRIEEILEGTGFDWLPVILGFYKTFELEGMEVKGVQFDELDGIDEGSLEVLTTRFTSLYNEEEQRRLQVESKANTIVGFTSIASGFIISFAQFLFATSSIGTSFFIVVVALYISISISWLITINLAMKPGSIRKYRQPTTRDLLRLRKNKSVDNYIEIYKKYVSELYHSYESNNRVNNKKLEYLNGAQLWFRNTTLLLLALMVTIAISFLSKPEDIATPYTEVIILTPTPLPISPTPSFSPTATNTVIPSPLPVLSSPTSLDPSPTTINISATITP